MAANRCFEGKSAHRCAFEHYLRTGQRLTTVEWLDGQERKFNPYHDELGRFTSPPGVSVSWGSHQRRRDRPRAYPEQPSSSHQSNPTAASRESGQPTTVGPTEDDAGFRSELVANATAAGGHAETYFELNRRQAGLNRLREAAGPAPSDKERADLDHFQARLDADRRRLDQREWVIDREAFEIFRAGNPLADLGAAGINVASGQAELRDVLAIAALAPIGKFGKVVGEAASPIVRDVVQLGGAHGVVRNFRGLHSHHIPPKKISPLGHNEGPAIAMLPADHRRTLSYGRKKDARAHQIKQKRLIDSGDFAAAQQMDIDDIKLLFGEKYDDAIDQMLKYTQKIGLRK
jgi:hypothetical protein